MVSKIDNLYVPVPARENGRLTPRQVEILQQLARGLSYKEIGQVLDISPSTVRAHLHSTYRKLQVKSRSLAVIKFHERGGLSAF